MKNYSINGANCPDKMSLFKEFSTALNFPDYFGDNWDSFEEIMFDLPDIKNLFIINFDSLLTEKQNDKEIFESIIQAINAEGIYKIYKAEMI